MLTPQNVRQALKTTKKHADDGIAYNTKAGFKAVHLPQYGKLAEKVAVKSKYAENTAHILVYKPIPKQWNRYPMLQTWEEIENDIRYQT